jgi:hypothetical protein
MNHIQKGFIAAALFGIISIATPVLAQSYYGGNGYMNSYYPQQSSYNNYGNSSNGNPMIYQVVNAPLMNHFFINMPSYNVPSYNAPTQYYPQQQQYTAQPYQQQNQYYGSGYSSPEYDPSYAPYSNYYTTYPQQNNGYTGDHDAFGSPLCNWQGYGRSDCSFNPHQWVYDPYTGTWY